MGCIGLLCLTLGLVSSLASADPTPSPSPTPDANLLVDNFDNDASYADAPGQLES
jgi:hypothetical protein